MTALSFACFRGQISVVRDLLNRDIYKEPALHLSLEKACESCAFEVVRLLLDRHEYNEQAIRTGAEYSV